MTTPAIETKSVATGSVTPTPPTPTGTPDPKNPPTDPGPFAHLSPEEKDRALAMLVGQVRSQSEESNKLKGQIEELTRKTDAAIAAQPPSKEDAKQFFEEPRKLVREEVQTAIKPLLEFIGSMGKMSEYDQLKARFKADVRFKPIFDVAEAQIDQAMRAPGVTVNENTLQLALASVKGSIDLGLMPGVRLAPAATQPPPAGAPPVAVPPYIPSSPPPGPMPPSNQPTVVTLNETEARLARESGMSPEQWVAYRDMQPSVVVTADRTKIDKPEKK